MHVGLVGISTIASGSCGSADAGERGHECVASVTFLPLVVCNSQRPEEESRCSPVVRLLVQSACAGRSTRHLPPPPPQPPLTRSPKARPVRGSGYCGHAHFSIMSSSACRKRKPLVQPETPQRSTRDSSLSSALHFLNEIPLTLPRREGRGKGRREEWSCRREKYFSFPLHSVRVERRSFGGGEGLDTVKKFVCLLDILFWSCLCTQGRVLPSNRLKSQRLLINHFHHC